MPLVRAVTSLLAIALLLSIVSAVPRDATATERETSPAGRKRLARHLGLASRVGFRGTRRTAFGYLRDTRALARRITRGDVTPEDGFDAWVGLATVYHATCKQHQLDSHAAALEAVEDDLPEGQELDMEAIEAHEDLGSGVGGPTDEFVRRLARMRETGSSIGRRAFDLIDRACTARCLELSAVACPGKPEHPVSVAARRAVGRISDAPPTLVLVTATCEGTLKAIVVGDGDEFTLEVLGLRGGSADVGVPTVSRVELGVDLIAASCYEFTGLVPGRTYRVEGRYSILGDRIDSAGGGTITVPRWQDPVVDPDPDPEDCTASTIEATVGGAPLVSDPDDWLLIVNLPVGESGLAIGGRVRFIDETDFTVQVAIDFIREQGIAGQPDETTIDLGAQGDWEIRVTIQNGAGPPIFVDSGTLQITNLAGYAEGTGATTLAVSGPNEVIDITVCPADRTPEQP